MDEAVDHSKGSLSNQQSFLSHTPHNTNHEIKTNGKTQVIFFISHFVCSKYSPHHFCKNAEMSLNAPKDKSMLS